MCPRFSTRLAGVIMESADKPGPKPGRRQRKPEPENTGPQRSLPELILLEMRVLCFCASEEELKSLGKHEYFFGMMLVWLAGMGRVWHDPHAHWIMKTGFSSVCYVFLLAIFVWVLIALIGPKDWKLGRLLIFICLTAPPAFLQAIPVQMFLPAYQAEWINIIFLLLVASWRLCLLVWYVTKTADLSLIRTSVAVFLPVATVINTVVWTDAMLSGIGTMGGVRRELRKIKTGNEQGPGGGFFNMAPAPATTSTQMSAPAMPTGPIDYSKPAQITNPYATPAQMNSPNMTPQRGRRRNVTSSTTGWLTSRGVQVAERPDAASGLQKLSIASPPKYVETIATPDGPVEVYSDVSIGIPGAPRQIPPGFEEIAVDDPVNSYKHPLTKLLTPVAVLCSIGFVPAFLAYTTFIFWRPKRQKDPEEELDDDDHDSSGHDEENIGSPQPGA